jgi:molybdate transport system substrate-binding protein
MIRINSARCIAAIGALLVLAIPASAAEIRVFSTGAPSVAAKVLSARETDNVYVFTVGQPDTLRQKLLAGEKADVVIAPAPVIAALEKDGKLRAGSSVDVARVGIGVVVREGAPRPNIATPAAIRKMLVDANSIAYPDPATGGGSTGKVLTQMIAQMGITDVVKPKLTLAHAITGGVKLVADGKAEVGMFNISEILPIKGVIMVGPLPTDLQHYITFTAGITATSAVRGDAAAFIALMADSAAHDAWTSAGLEPLGGGH